MSLLHKPELSIATFACHFLISLMISGGTFDASGDRTSYSLSIKEHYASEVKRREDEAEDSETNGRMAFAYSFKILDLKSLAQSIQPLLGLILPHTRS